MKSVSFRAARPLWLAAASAVLLCASLRPTAAAEFSVTPIRAELKPGALSETITVTNESPGKLRLVVKLFEWTQDASGGDVYRDSSDLVYFPRQLELEPAAKRLIRVGARAPASGSEKTYRLFIEEIPESGGDGQNAVNFYFRFGVPVFLPPPAAKPLPVVGEPTLAKGQLLQPVGNTGNQHFRLNKLTVTDRAGWSHEIAGWYSLAGTSRSYTAAIPREACRKATTLFVKLEGEGLSFDRTVNVDPASCS